MDQWIQAYFNQLYREYKHDIKRSLFAKNSSEIYGELYYYGLLKLLKYLKLEKTDHFLDIGSGLGRIVFQLMIEAEVASVTGVEINQKRYEIACKIKGVLERDLPEIYLKEPEANSISGVNSLSGINSISGVNSISDVNSISGVKLICGNFLEEALEHITVIYTCSTVYPSSLLNELGKKINQMPNVRKVASLRKIPHLTHFDLSQKIFLHCTWDSAPCYFYTRKI